MINRDLKQFLYHYIILYHHEDPMNIPFNWWRAKSSYDSSTMSRCRWDWGESSTDEKKPRSMMTSFSAKKICLPEKLMVYLSLSSFSPPRFIWVCDEFSIWCSCHSTRAYLKWPLIAASKRAMLPQNDQRIGATMKLGMDVHNCNMNRYDSYPHISG